MKIFEIAGEGKLHGLTVMSLDAFVKKEEGVEESNSPVIANTADRLSNKDDGRTAKLRAAGDARREQHLKGRDIAKNDRTSKDAWGDLKERASQLLSAEDRNGVITVIVQAPDGTKKSLANDNPRYINQWLEAKYGLTLPKSIMSKFVESGLTESFKSKEEAVAYAKDRAKTFRDPEDGIEVWAMPGGGFDVTNTNNSSGRNHIIDNGGKKLGTIGARHRGVAEAKYGLTLPKSIMSKFVNENS